MYDPPAGPAPTTTIASSRARARRHGPVHPGALTSRSAGSGLRPTCAAGVNGPSGLRAVIPVRTRQAARTGLLGMALLAVVLAAPGGLAQTAGKIGGAGQIIDGIAPVGPANTVPNPQIGGLDVLLVPDPAAPRREIVRKRPREHASAELLRSWAARGAVAGFANLVYDNRDGGHSSLGAKNHPQLAFTTYSPVFEAEGLHYGVAGPLRFSLPTIGNSSTARTGGPLWRSQARAALQDQPTAMRTWQLYASNHLYAYPEHRDHDAGIGDRFFANTPYLVTAQGSSGSDRPFVAALLEAAAAMQPATQARLIAEGLLSPTLQMLLRRTMTGIETDDDYMSGAAHPSVFEPDRIDRIDLLTRAHALEADAIPPMVLLTVEEDLEAIPGIDYLARNLSEAVFTTPSAIARAWRSRDYTRSMVLSVAETEDPNGRDLRFHWRLLRGDPGKVRIEPLDAAGTRVRIELDWHDLQVVTPAEGDREELTSFRVDIGVFADNGATLSAPAMLSVVFPVHQDRVYEAGRDGGMRLREMTVSGSTRRRSAEKYADPVIWPLGDWTDTLIYDDDGRLERIERRHRGAEEIETLLPGLAGPLRVDENGSRVAFIHSARRQPDRSFALVVDELTAETVREPADQ